jgi:mono/diheme cytochrome c family protein
MNLFPCGSRVAVAGATVMLALSLPPNLRGHDPVASASWDRDVRPLVRARCLSCHRPNGPAHPVLASVDDFRTHRDAIKDAVLNRRMPPWSAMRGYGAFARDPSLSPLQISLVASWIEAGAPGSVSAAANLLEPLLMEAGRSPSAITRELPAFQGTQQVQRRRLNVDAHSPVAVTGWRFMPGSPSVRSVRVLDADGRLLWVSPIGFEQDNYPAGTGIVLKPPVQLTVEASAPTGAQVGETTAASSYLELEVATRPVIRLDTITWQCGESRVVNRPIYGFRPTIESDTEVEVRTTPDIPRVLALFRGPTRGPQTYWLRDPFAPVRGSQVTVLGDRCSVDVIVGSRAPERP